METISKQSKTCIISAIFILSIIFFPFSVSAVDEDSGEILYFVGK